MAPAVSATTRLADAVGQPDCVFGHLPRNRAWTRLQRVRVLERNRPTQYSCVPFLVPEPPKPLLHEYWWPSAAASSAATFAIVSKDGVVHLAAAVWIAAGTLRFTSPQGLSEGVPLEAIDREATRRLNSLSGLTLHLPAPQAASPNLGSRTEIRGR